MSRPEKNIDLDDLQKILTLYPSMDEVSAWFDCSPDTVERRVREVWGITFKELRERSAGRTRLLLKRRAIAKALEEDNEKMLLFCLRTMTDLDDRKLPTETLITKKMQSVEYTLEFLSDDEKKL
jgi:AraC-like DNA-binding protein